MNLPASVYLLSQLGDEAGNVQHQFFWQARGAVSRKSRYLLIRFPPKKAGANIYLAASPKIPYQLL